jgi:alpha-1,3-rhamnosyl/mannosyltransferase
VVPAGGDAWRVDGDVAARGFGLVCKRLNNPAAPAGTGAPDREEGHGGMRVVVNRLAALGLKTGIGHYTTQLLRCLSEQAAPGEIDVFPRGWVRRVREACALARPRLESGGPSGSGRPVLARLRGAALSGLRQGGRALMAGYFRAVCHRQRYDLYHETNYIPLPANLPTVATLCDLSVLLYPEWHPRDRVVHFERHFRRGLGRCAHFLAISEAGRREVIRTLGIAPERVTRTYMGIRPGLGPLPRAEVEAALRGLGLPPRYLLYLGTIEPRKNVLTLLRAYCSLPEWLRREYPLLLVGGWGWNAGNVAAYLDGEAKHRGVLHLGYVAEQHLAALYGGARALAFPSFYEGFGLPPMEMLACGGAVLASTAGALAETVGGQAHLIDPHDVSGWRAALVRVLQDDDWWRSLRQGAVEAARPYTWEQCAADTLRVYRRLAEGRSPAAPDKRAA